MGVVLQNGQLMSDDIFTNIVGTTALTQDDAWEAAKAAGLDEDIKKMPMGMQTVISEGASNISGGQRQRILIARALAAKPAILIFDEATSVLDNRTQAIVTESLNKRNVTRIVVAHRLSTIEDCDRIIVLDKGKIVENGTFDELVALNLDSHNKKFAFSSWLFKIASNSLADYFRSQKRNREDSWDEFLEREAPKSDPLEEKLLASELTKELLRALDKLSERQRRIIELKYWSELSNVERT